MGQEHCITEIGGEASVVARTASAAAAAGLEFGLWGSHT